MRMLPMPMLHHAAQHLHHAAQPPPVPHAAPGPPTPQQLRAPGLTPADLPSPPPSPTPLPAQASPASCPAQRRWQRRCTSAATGTWPSSSWGASSGAPLPPLPPLLPLLRRLSDSKTRAGVLSAAQPGSRLPLPPLPWRPCAAGLACGGKGEDLYHHATSSDTAAFPATPPHTPTHPHPHPTFRGHSFFSTNGELLERYAACADAAEVIAAQNAYLAEAATGGPDWPSSARQRRLPPALRLPPPPRPGWAPPGPAVRACQAPRRRPACRLCRGSRRLSARCHRQRAALCPALSAGLLCMPESASAAAGEEDEDEGDEDEDGEQDEDQEGEVGPVQVIGAEEAEEEQEVGTSMRACNATPPAAHLHLLPQPSLGGRGGRALWSQAVQPGAPEAAAAAGCSRVLWAAQLALSVSGKDALPLRSCLACRTPELVTSTPTLPLAVRRARGLWRQQRALSMRTAAVGGQRAGRTRQRRRCRSCLSGSAAGPADAWRCSLYYYCYTGKE
jgi:hypothetical protein